MFYNADKFTGVGGVGADGIEAWDTTKASTMQSMFLFAIEFNAPIQQWNVEQVTSFKNIFKGATKFDQPVGQWNIVNVKAGGLSDVFQASTNPATTGMSSCNKRLVADAWASNVVFKTTETIGPTNAVVPYVTAWRSETCPALTDATFKKATWDWVNMGARVASAKWGTIDKWDTSGVKSFNNAFNQFRDEDGTIRGAGVAYNSKAASFNADLPWSTESVTSMASMFYSASAFNGDVSSFNTAAVIDFSR
jgi:surface protein